MGNITTEEKEYRRLLLDHGLKKCNKCNKVLPVERFHKQKNSSDGFCSNCKDCYKEYWDKYYKRNKEKKKKYAKEYREDHHEEVLQKQCIYRQNNPNRNKKYYYKHKEDRKEQKKIDDKEYYKKHRDEILEYQKQYGINNRDAIKERRRQYYEKNREQILKKKKEYRSSHKEERIAYLKSDKGKAISRANHENRRARIKNNGGSFSAEDVSCALSFFNNQCAYTGEKLDKDYHLDHVIPISNGGSNYIYNIVPCNRLANLSKHTRDMEEWYREQPYFSENRLQKIYEWINIKQNKIEGDQKDGYKYTKETS